MIYKSKFENRGVKGAFIPKRMTGFGSELAHAVKVYTDRFGRAACGARPKAVGWEYEEENAVTCPRCLDKVTRDVKSAGIYRS